MAYNNAIPQANDLISSSQGQILGNFTAIDSSVYGFTREHVTLTDTTNGGLHKLATMPDTASVTPAAGYGAYYTSKTGTEGGAITEAVYKSGDASSISILSAIKAWGVFSGSTKQDGFNFSSVSNPATGQYVVNFTNTLPNANYCVLVMGDMQSNFTSGSIIGTASQSTSSFQINCRTLTGAFGATPSRLGFVVLQS